MAGQDPATAAAVATRCTRSIYWASKAIPRFEDAKKAWRKIAKETHPDVNPGNADAAKAFQAGQAAYDVLRVAEERREWKG